MLYLSRILKGDLRFYDLLGILERPEKNLIVFNNVYRDFYICILSNKNPGPIKMRYRNKWIVLFFDRVDEPLFKMSDIKTTRRYLVSDRVWDFCYIHSQYTGFVVKGTDCYYYYSDGDIRKTQVFYEALRNETNLTTGERD